MGLAVYLNRVRWDRETLRLVEELKHPVLAQETTKVTFRGFDQLPEPVARYLRLALKEGQPLIRSVRIKQVGNLRGAERRRAGWMPFRAVQSSSALRPAFVWDAQIRASRLMPMRVRDAYVAGQGAGRVSAFSLVTLADEHGGAELAKGELLRYLAESVWFPTALLPSPRLAWSPMDGSNARATLTDAGTTVSLEFRFNDAGEVTSVYTPDRPRAVGGGYERTPWGGRHLSYKERDGMWVPTEAEVEWHLRTGCAASLRARSSRPSTTILREGVINMIDTDKVQIDTSLPPRRKLSRRQLIAAVAGAGMTAVLGEALVTYAPWQDYEAQARRTWNTPFQTGSAVPAQMRELVRYATLAPSGHNTQPWRFAVFGDMIRILPDYSRRLPAVDPQDRELWISLGCALENLVIAANAAGYAADVTHPTPDADHITLHLSRSSAHVPVPLLEAIPHRQNNRSLYDGRSAPPAETKKMEAVQSGAGVSTLIFTDAAHKEAIIEYIKAGDRQQFGDPAFVAELVSWIRFNKPESLHSLDGLYTRCTGNPDVPRWLGRRFLTAASAGSQADTSARKARSSAGLIVIAAASDDKRHWIETGRLYERLALTLTASGIQVAFLNQPAEVPGLRSQFQGYLGLGMARPQLLLRFGYADALPHSLRRPIEEVLV